MSSYILAVEVEDESDVFFTKLKNGEHALAFKNPKRVFLPNTSSFGSQAGLDIDEEILNCKHPYDDVVVSSGETYCKRCCTVLES